MRPVLQVPAFVMFAHVLPSVPGTHTATPFWSWHDCPVLHEFG